MSQLKAWFDKAKRKHEITKALCLAALFWLAITNLTILYVPDSHIVSIAKVARGIGMFTLLAYPAGMGMLVVLWPNFPTIKKEIE